MDIHELQKYKDFDKYFVCGYFDENKKHIGVFSADTPSLLIKYAETVFEVIEFE